MVTIPIDTNERPALQGIQKVNRELDELGKNGGRSLGGLRGLAKGAALGVAGIGVAAVGAGVALAKRFLESGQEIDALSNRLGISRQSLSAWGLIAMQNDLQLKSFGTSVTNLNNRLLDAQQGTTSVVESFDALGLSIGDLEGLAPEELFNVVTERLAAIEDPVRRDAAAFELLGKQGAGVVGALVGVEGGLRGITKEAIDSGKALSGDAVRSAAQVAAGYDALKQRALVSSAKDSANSSRPSKESPRSSPESSGQSSAKSSPSSKRTYSPYFRSSDSSSSRSARPSSDTSKTTGTESRGSSAASSTSS